MGGVAPSPLPAELAGDPDPGGRPASGMGLVPGEVDAAVVVAPLDEDEVTGLDELESEIPVAAGDVAMAGETADGAVDDVDLGGVEEVGMGWPQPQRPSEPVPPPLRTVESPMRMREGRLGLAGSLRPRRFTCPAASSWGRTAGGAPGVAAAGADAAGAICCAAKARRGIRQVTAAASRAWFVDRGFRSIISSFVAESRGSRVLIPMDAIQSNRARAIPSTGSRRVPLRE